MPNKDIRPLPDEKEILIFLPALWDENGRTDGEVLMTDREVVIAHLDDLRLFADVTVHPVVSPDNWNVYASLCDYIDQIKTEVEKLLKEQEALEERHKALVDAADDLRAELKEANQRIWELLCEKEKLASCIYDDGK